MTSSSSILAVAIRWQLYFKTSHNRLSRIRLALTFHRIHHDTARVNGSWSAGRVWYAAALSANVSVMPAAPQNNTRITIAPLSSCTHTARSVSVKSTGEGKLSNASKCSKATPSFIQWSLARNSRARLHTCSTILLFRSDWQFSDSNNACRSMNFSRWRNRTDSLVTIFIVKMLL